MWLIKATKGSCFIYWSFCSKVSLTQCMNHLINEKIDKDVFLYSDEERWALIIERKNRRLGRSLQTVWTNSRPEQSDASQPGDGETLHEWIHLTPIRDISCGGIWAAAWQSVGVHMKVSVHVSAAYRSHPVAMTARHWRKDEERRRRSSFSAPGESIKWRPCLAEMSFVLRVTLVFRPWG